MPEKLDEIEKEYIRAINYAKNDDEAYELSIYLKQYREMFKEEGRNG